MKERIKALHMHCIRYTALHPRRVAWLFALCLVLELCIAVFMLINYDGWGILPLGGFFMLLGIGLDLLYYALFGKYMR